MLVSNEPLRTAFLRDERSAYALAAQLGWRVSRRVTSKSHGHADSDRVQRELGLKPYHNRGRVIYKRRVNEHTALHIASLLGLDPVDIGV